MRARGTAFALGSSVRLGPLIFALGLSQVACTVLFDGDRYREGGPGADATPGTTPDAAAGATPDAAGTSACGESCVGGDCDLQCRAGDGCACELDCGGTSGLCKAKCRDADCAIDCAGVGTCEAECEGMHACEIDCSSAGDCHKVRCKKGATCLLDCDGSDPCGFEACEGGVTDCGGGLWACNRACP